MSRRKPLRKGSVGMTLDDYSVADKYWKLYKNSPTGGDRPRRSLLRGKSVHFDYFDEDWKTPLMKSIEKKFIKKTLNLLLFGADPNIQQQTTGDTALHLAVDTGNILLVKLLLVFNADPTLCNKYCQAPLDIALLMKQKHDADATISLMRSTAFAFIKLGDSKGSDIPKRNFSKEALKGDIHGIITVLMEAARLQAKSHHYFTAVENFFVPAPHKCTDTYLLSLDGGGVRVFNVLQAIVNIEQRMTDLTGIKQKLYTYFDYIGGTGMGGMAACILTYLESDAYNSRGFCFKTLLDMRLASPDQRGKKMDSTLQDLFTEELTMTDLNPRQRVIVTATLAEYSPYELHLMTSYGEPRNRQAGPRERKVWEACRITTCIPSFFPLLRNLKLLDGGLLGTNPTLDCMSEIIDQGEREGKNIKFGCVVSIGTGMECKKEAEDVELFLPSFFSILSSKNIHAMKNHIQHFVNQTVLSDGAEVSNARSFCDALGCQYLRLTPPLKENISMDSIDESSIIDMLYTTQMYYLDNPELIDSVAKALLSK